MDKKRKKIQSQLVLGILFLVIGLYLSVKSDLMHSNLFYTEARGTAGYFMLLFANSYFIKIVAYTLSQVGWLRKLLNLTAFILRAISILFVGAVIVNYKLLMMDSSTFLLPHFQKVFGNGLFGLQIYELLAISAMSLLMLGIFILFNFHDEWIKDS